jgi:thiol-disulfide isomerase/thioredoxin
MADPLEARRGGPIDPPRLLPPLPGPDEADPGGGWLTVPPPEPPWVVGMWSASCHYCKKGLGDLVPLAEAHGVPFVALHVPEFPDEGAPGVPERTLAELGLPLPPRPGPEAPARRGVHHHRDAREWASLVAMTFWPTFLVVDARRRATFVLIGWAGHSDSMYGPLARAIEAAAGEVARPPAR